jgi:ribosome-binding protein aMBF1 (putative translation factor)
MRPVHDAASRDAGGAGDHHPGARLPAPVGIAAGPRGVAQDATSEGLEVVAQALRGARARTGMSEQQVVAKLAEDGFAITVARLRLWERTGLIRLDAASRLADAYGITMDSLAGRRAYGSHQRAG